MSLEEIITSIVGPVVNGRCWESSTPDKLQRDANDRILPFVIWTLPGGIEQEYIDQTMPEMRNARIQINVVGPSSIECSRIIRQVRDALVNSAYTVGVYGSPGGTYDQARNLRGRRQQFGIWYKDQ